MRIVKAFLFLSLLFLGYGANATEETPKVLLHVNDGFKLGHLRNSVINLRKDFGENIDIKVVINGKAVTRMLKSNKDSTRIVNSILEQKVAIGLCHNAVSANKVKKTMLIDGLDMLELGGNTTIINYSQKGYVYIKL